MNQTWIWIVSLSLIVAMAPGMGADEGKDTSEQPIVGAVDTPDGIELVRAGDISPLDEHRVTCGGEAPLEFHCSNGEQYRGPGSILHGCLIEEGDSFTGTVESRLQHDDGERVFYCEYVDGETQDLYGFGDFPSQRSTFDQDCFSVETGTEGLLYAEEVGLLAEGQPTSVPGGEGPWNCFLEV